MPYPINIQKESVRDVTSKHLGRLGSEGIKRIFYVSVLSGLIFQRLGDSDMKGGPLVIF